MKSTFGTESYCPPETITVTQSVDMLQTVGRSAQINTVDLEKIAAGVRLILEGIGEDVDRKGLLQTPARVARMYQELFYGVGINPADELVGAFYENTEELVLVKDIPFFSVCEHHMVPFIGVAHVGYIPQSGKIIGLSKLARVVELASRRLQVQERMTNQIADALMEKLQPAGVVVALQAEHLCMSMRGIKKAGSKTITSAVRGIIQSDPLVRAEIMSRLWANGTNNSPACD